MTSPVCATERVLEVNQLFCGAFRFCPSSQVGHVDRLSFCNKHGLFKRASVVPVEVPSTLFLSVT